MALIDERYAQALLDLIADGKANADVLRRELEQFVRLLEESRPLHAVLASPAVSRPQKLAVLDALVERLHVSRLTRNFLAVATERGRAAQLPGIVRAFERLWLERSGVRRAEIVSARPLSAEERVAIEQALAAVSAATIEASYRQDEDLIGGFVARVGDTVYDGSLRGRLNRLRQQLTAV